MQNKFKRLAIISDCVHKFDTDGAAVTENHIYCKQMQALASAFQHTTVCCPFEKNIANDVTSKYTLGSMEFIPLPNVGGNSIKDKLAVLRAIPSWIRAFRKANASSDIVYMRFPNNLSIPGFFYFYFKKAKTFAQYTGTWEDYKTEPHTYRFQKWLLKKYFKGPVWVYAYELKNDGHLFMGISPSYTSQEWDDETGNVQQRIELYQNRKIEKPVFITVGALVANKNQRFILEAFKLLYEKSFSFCLYIVGAGPLMKEYNEFIKKNNLNKCVILAGKKTSAELQALYRQSHFIVQAPLAEGFGKVPIEGFFHGLLPFLNNVALAKNMTGNNERGFIFSAGDPAKLAGLIHEVMNDQSILPAMVANGRQYAKLFTIENWVNNYLGIINYYFD